MTMPLCHRLKTLGADPKFVGWCQEQNHTTIEDVWAVCLRGDWLLWLAARLAGPSLPERASVISALCDCVDFTYPYVTPGEVRPAKMVEAARAFLQDDTSVAGVVLASISVDALWKYRADEITDALAAKAAAHLGFTLRGAETYSRSFADHARNVALSVAHTVWVADLMGSPGRYFETLAECADIARHYFPTPPKLEI